MSTRNSVVYGGVGSQNHSPKDIDVPHNVSTCFVVLLAIVMPLKRILWDVYSIYHSEYPYLLNDMHSPRFLQQNECIINATLFNTTNYNEISTPPSTMAAIATSLIISFSIGTFSFLLYEAFRRDPIVGKYVYDRKRLTQPSRTPPPLMLSRSLWRGNEQNDHSEEKRWFKWCSWWKVRPALFELYFLTLDEVYIRYSLAADNARKEREKRGYLTCCRAGCYHNNCCNTVRIRSEDNEEGDEYFVNEDGYVFNKDFKHELGFQHQGVNQYETPKFSPRNELTTSTIVNSHSKGFLVNQSTIVSTPSTGERRVKYSIKDLYPEDFRGALVETKSKANRRLVVQISDGNDSYSINDEPRIESINKENTSTHKDIHLNVGTSTDEYKYTNEGNGDIPPLKYPYRLVTYFLPPGFHNWTNAIRFVSEFFFVSKLSWHLAKVRAALFGGTNISMSKRHEIKMHEDLIVLTAPEEELLRCAGLDTYLMIRFARFGFDVCFYPFLFACITVFPIYITCDTEKIFDVQNNEVLAAASGVIDGLFRLTINRIPPGSGKMYWIIVFNFFLYFFVLRRLWLEWEIIIKLRHRYLSNGDENFHVNPMYLKKYRNSVIVECIPKSYRSDHKIYQVFEELFPGQIESAEMLIDTMDLDITLDKRRAFIEKFESVEARYQFQHWKYFNSEQNSCCSKEPRDPVMRQSCCGKKESALDFYKTRIREYDYLAASNYDKIVEARLNRSSSSTTRLETSEGQASSFDLFPHAVREAFGMRTSDLFCSTAVVEFKSITTKQSAVQCNLFGEPYTFITKEAPDPRDVLWSNIICDHRFIEKRKVVVEFVLVILVLTWGAFVATITNIANSTIDGLKVMNFDLTRFRLYIPTLIISLILLWIPMFLFTFAMRIIKFKSFSQCDEFVIKWNTAFRVTNILFIFFSISLVDAIKCFKDEPEKFIQSVALGVLEQSSILLNLIIIATGQETMLQLLQWRSIIKQAVCRPLINFNSRSKRFLDSLNEPPPFEQACIFGYFSPVLSYGLMIGMIYSYMAPHMLGACSFFFWVATKVHTHNALFVYCEPFSGGGKIFYYWNRIVFATLYGSILIFFGILAIKRFYKAGTAFVLIMLLVTIFVDKAITNTFVIHSFDLPIKIARNHDDEEIAFLEKSKLKKDGGENFMYRNPMLNQQNWDEKPFRWM